MNNKPFFSAEVHRTQFSSHNVSELVKPQKLNKLVVDPEINHAEAIAIVAKWLDDQIKWQHDFAEYSKGSGIAKQDYLLDKLIKWHGLQSLPEHKLKALRRLSKQKAEINTSCDYHSLAKLATAFEALLVLV